MKKKDYSSLIDFILDDPRNKLTDMARDLLKELSKELVFPKLKTEHKPEWHSWDDEIIKDYQIMAENYHRDAEGYFDDDV